MSRRLDHDEIAIAYWEAGWNPFPLPRGAKFPPLPGFTGEAARDITRRDITRWSGQFGNIGLRMPDGVIGIDIDGYKHPGLKFPSDLPGSFCSTNRDDGISGIYPHRVPPGSKFTGVINGIGETIQPHHRYAVVWPSLHPEGRTYRWLNGLGEEIGIPDIDELPELPESWLQRLADRSPKRGKRSGYDGDGEAWFDGLRRGTPSPAVRAALRKTVRELRRYAVSGGCRHDIMLSGIGRLVALGAAGQRGVEDAIDELYTEYVTAVEGTPDRDPEAELSRAIIGAIKKFGGKR